MKKWQLTVYWNSGSIQHYTFDSFDRVSNLIDATLSMNDLLNIHHFKLQYKELI